MAAFSSLADELGGFDDELGRSPLSPGGFGGFGHGGGGMSLADEFGFEEPQELAASGGLGSLASELDQGFGDEYGHAQSLDHMDDDPIDAGPSSMNGLGLGLAPALSLGSGRGRKASHRRQVSHRSSHASLRVGTELENGYSSMDDDDFVLPSGPSPEIEALNDAMATSKRLVSLLRGMDDAAGSSPTAPPRAGSAPGPRDSPGASVPTLPLEERLYAHHLRVTEAEKTRDKQTRAAAALVRELDSVRGEGLEVNLDWIHELLPPPVEGRTPGWTGELVHDEDDLEDPYDEEPEPTTPKANGFHSSNGISRRRPAPLSPVRERTMSPDDPLSPGPMSPESPVSPISPISPVSPVSPLSHRPALHRTSRRDAPSHPLSRASAALGEDVGTLAAVLGSLGETVSVALAISASTSRQTRGLRHQVAGVREREATEETCRRGVEVWEARAASGDVPDARRDMADVVQGFAATLADAERRMQALRGVSV